MSAQQAVTDEQLLAAALQMLKAGEDAHKKRIRRYDHSYDVYAASDPRAQGVEPWQSKIRVPYARMSLDTAMVNMVAGQPRIMVKARSPQYVKGAEALQHILDYYVAEDHLVEKRPWFVQQALVYGATVAKNHWLYKETLRPGMDWQDSPIPGGLPVGKQRVEKVVLRDGPTFETWNVYDCWWDPFGRDVDQASYVVLRSWPSKNELERQRYNPDTGEGIYHNLDDLYATGDGPRSIQTAQQRRLGGDSRSMKGRFEILEIWTDNQVLVLGNRKVIIRNEGNPFWHGQKPVVIAQTRPELFEMQGTPETELIDHLQQAAWTVQNMRFDNLHLTVQRMLTYRDGGVTDVNALAIRPRAKIPVTDHDDIHVIDIPPLPPEAYREQESLQGLIQQMSGINPFVTGGDMTGVDQNTATGVTALQEVASRLLRFFASQIHYKGEQRSFEMWGDMTQQFLDKPIDVQILGPGNETEWRSIGPQEIAGHYRYILEGSEESLSRQQERSEAVQLLNAFAPLAPLGIVNWKPLLEKVAVAFDFPNPEQLFLPQQQMPPAAPHAPGALPPGQQPPQPPADGLQQPNGAGGLPNLVGGQGIDPRILAAIQQGNR